MDGKAPGQNRHHLGVVLVAGNALSQSTAKPTPSPQARQSFDRIVSASLGAMGGEAEIGKIRNIRALADCVGPRGEYSTEIHSARGDRLLFRAVRVVINEWKLVDRVRLPSRVTVTDKSGDWILDFDDLTINTIDESIFAVPPGVAAP